MLPSTVARVPGPHLLEALRLPELYRAVCGYAGLAPPPAPAREERFVLRCGAEPPEFFSKLLEEAFVEDEAEVPVGLSPEPPDFRRLSPGQCVVQPGFDIPCPAAERLKKAVRPGGGSALLFAIERRDAVGRLLGLTWAAVPEEEPAPEAGFRAAVLRWDVAGPCSHRPPTRPS